MTPQEAWSGHKPCVSHLRIFGSIAYAHIPDEGRSKLDDKSEKCIFVGYSEHSKAYKLYNPITQKTIISRDVMFNEEESWDWAPSDDKKKSIIIEEESNVPSDGNNDRCPPSPPSSPGLSSSSSSSSESSPSPPKKIRNLQEVYNNTQQIELADFALFADADPVDFDEAIREDKWKKAMDQEIQSIEKNKTWELMELPNGHKPIGVKWVYKTKLNEKGEVEKYKARLVVKGYKQKYGFDYNEVFAPVIRLETIRLVLSLAAQNGWIVHQMDVKSAFLNGDLEEEVYIDQPPGYTKKGEEHKVYRLKKALYGLKQAPRAWYSRIDGYFLMHGFKRCPYEHTLYIKESKGDFLFVCLYVDDLIFTGNCMSMVEDFKRAMKHEFEMTDMGLLHYFLGIEVKQGEDGISISQKMYAKEILKKFRMEGATPISTPMEFALKLSKNAVEKDVESTLYRSLVGSLMYLTNTRPDIMYAVSMISRFMESPKQSHWEAAKRILRYVIGTIDHGIHYGKVKDPKLIGFCDSDWGGSADDCKSTSGFIFSLGSGAISWQSKKQTVVALSTTEAEYISLSSTGCQAIWLRGILEELKHPNHGSTKLYCDNRSAIALTKNPVFHGKSKHIKIKYHFIRDLINGGEVEVHFCSTGEQVADIFTKALKVGDFNKMKRKLGVIQV